MGSNLLVKTGRMPLNAGGVMTEREKVGSQLIRAKVYPLMQDAVDAGVRYGWNRAHKHDSTPSEDIIVNAITDAVMNEICEKFEFLDGTEN